MPVQTTTRKEEKEALSELRKALKSNHLAPVLERQPDRYLLRFLKRHYTHAWWISAIWVIGFLSIVIQLTLFLMGKTSKPVNPGFLLFWLPGFILTARETVSPAADLAIKDRLESASLPTLLEAYELDPLVFRYAILELIIKRLTLATLRIPGGEHVCLADIADERANLRSAIAEYKAALGESR